MVLVNRDVGFDGRLSCEIASLPLQSALCTTQLGSVSELLLCRFETRHVRRSRLRKQRGRDQGQRG